MLVISKTFSTRQFRMSGLMLFLRLKTHIILVTCEVSHVSMGPYLAITCAVDIALLGLLDNEETQLLPT